MFEKEDTDKHELRLTKPFIVNSLHSAQETLYTRMHKQTADDIITSIMQTNQWNSCGVCRNLCKKAADRGIPFNQDAFPPIFTRYSNNNESYFNKIIKKEKLLKCNIWLIDFQSKSMTFGWGVCVCVGEGGGDKQNPKWPTFIPTLIHPTAHLDRKSVV